MLNPLVSGVIRLGEESDFEKRLRAQWGESITAHLKAAGMTRTQLAQAMEELGVPTSQQSLSQWILGQLMPRPLAQVAMARVFRVPVHSLFPMDIAA